MADRYNRKQILIATALVRAIIVFCFLFIRNPGQVWLLYTLTGIQLGLSGIFYPARNAMLPNIVAPRELGTANVISGATWSTMLAVGAALGGLVSGTWGIYPAFTIDALTFLISIIFIAQIKLDVSDDLTAVDASLGAALQQYLDGLRYLGQQVNVLVIALHKAAIGVLLGSTFEIVQVSVAKDVFTIGKDGGISLGLIFGVTGIGIALGPIAARHFTADRQAPMSWTIVLGYLIGGMGLALTAPLMSFGTILVGTLLRGIGNGIIWVFSTQLMMQLVPNHIRGRVFSTEFAFSTLMSAMAAAVVGSALDSSLGISGVAWWMAGLTLIPAGLWAFWLLFINNQQAVENQL